MAKSDWFVRNSNTSGTTSQYHKGKHLPPVSFSKTENKKKLNQICLNKNIEFHEQGQTLPGLPAAIVSFTFRPCVPSQTASTAKKQSEIIIRTYKLSTNPKFVVALPASASDDLNPVDCVISVSGFAAVFSVLRCPRGRSRHAGDRRFVVPVRSERHWQECPFARAGQDP